MFAELMPLLDEGASATLTVSRIGDSLRLVLIPPSAVESKLQPIVLEGTPAELDAPGICFTPIVEARKAIADSIAIAAAESKAAEDERQKKARERSDKAFKKKNEPAKPVDDTKGEKAPTGSDILDAKEPAETESPASDPAPAATAPAPATKTPKKPKADPEKAAAALRAEIAEAAKNNPAADELFPL